MGEVLLMSHVKVHVDNGDKKERLFVLFPGVVVILSVSPRMSGYLYEVSVICFFNFYSFL